MKQLLLCLLLFASSCAVDKPGVQSRQGSVNRDEAIKIARAEIRRRHLPLPKEVTVSVEDSWVDEEFVAARAIHLVRLSPAPTGKNVVLYEICVNQRTGGIEDFTDMKDIEP